MIQYNIYLLQYYIIILLSYTFNEIDAKQHKRMYQPLSLELIHYINYEVNEIYIKLYYM